MLYCHIIDGKIAHGPSTLDSPYYILLFKNGNPEALSKEILFASGVLQVEDEPLGRYQEYGELKVFEDKIVRRAINKSLDRIKTEKKIEISDMFVEELSNGRVDTGFGWEVDARRSGSHNDLQNIQSLHEYMVDNDIPDIFIKGADNEMHYVTRDNVAAIYKAIRNNGLSLYQKKFQLESMIDKASEINELSGIIW